LRPFFDGILGEINQQGVGLRLLLQRFLEQILSHPFPWFLWPSTKRAISSDIVTSDGLKTAERRCVRYWL